MMERLASGEIILGSLSLLDDIAGQEAQKRLEDFPALDGAIEESLGPIALTADTAVMHDVVSVAAETPLSNTAGSALETPLEKTDLELKKTNIVLTNSLGHRTSVQKAQNESLIKALQDLRAKMQESKLKSGKVLNNKA